MKLSIFSLALSLTLMPLCYSMTSDKQLYFAVHSGNLQQVQEALQNGAHVNAQYFNGSTLLHMAANFGYTKIVESLLSHNANINAQDHDGNTPLYFAANGGNVEIVKLLINAGLSINNPNNNGNTPLYCAASKGHTEMVKFLLTQGAHVNVQDLDGSTPLEIAAGNGHVETVKLLINAGAHINSINSDAETPIYTAIIAGHSRTAKLLLDAGINITLKNKDGHTALDLAKNYNKQDIIQALEEYPLLQKEAQESPNQETLRKAIEGNYPNLVTLILKNGVIAYPDDLNLAKELDHKEIGHMLIKYLGATTGQYTIAKNGILNLGLPTHIVQHSMSHAL